MRVSIKTLSTLAAATSALTILIGAGPAIASPDPVSPSQVTAEPAVAAPQTTSLTVSIEGVRSPKGKVRAGLLKADLAAGVANSAGGVVEAASVGSMTLTFQGLEPGEYAVQIFHDENDNGEMDSNLFGIPSEGYGFSNGAKASFGPPKFSEMKVVVGAEPAQTTARMSY